MRLLNVHTYALHEFIGTDIPYYAILSHCWESEEVTFQALKAGEAAQMKGWIKIKGCCEQAIEEGLKYAWINTCCIDKSSSAELSEAINSMFSWYQMAESCYVYLFDVFFDPHALTFHGSDPEWLTSFQRSRWFKRGWTLQELLAPGTVVFFDKNWVEFGTKESLEDQVASITGIRHLFDFKKASIAQRFSWASKRETTRIEDTSYCLMGIFGVNMPLLYGEGAAAFLRLQLEILKISNDETLFAWEDPSLVKGGLLASSPRCFKSSYNIRRLHPPLVPRLPYAMTNNGLEFEAQLVPRQDPNMPKTSKDEYLCPLNCAREGNEADLISLLLSRLDILNARRAQRFSRVHCDSLETLELKDIAAENMRRQTPHWSETILVQQPEPHTSRRSRNRGQCTFRINFQGLLSCGFNVEEQVLADSELGYWAKTTEDGLLVLKLFNSRARILFEKLNQQVELKVSCQGDPCFFLRSFLISYVSLDITKAVYVPSSGFSFIHSRRVGEEHCGSSKIVLMVLKKKFPNRQYFDVELTIRDSKDHPLGKPQETNPIKGHWDRHREGDKNELDNGGSDDSDDSIYSDDSDDDDD